MYLISQFLNYVLKKKIILFYKCRKILNNILIQNKNNEVYAHAYNSTKIP